ncbi:MAG TPA: glycosyltransferase [Methylococcaceae bacterium]|nr:glycosyltransferase [Methylococcaceae bacterium]
MKIFQVIQGVDNLSAGPTYSVGYLSHHLAERKHETKVLALGTQPAVWPYASSLDIFSGTASRLGFPPWKAVRYVRQEMVREPAILHGHGVWRAANLFPLLVPAKAPVKIVWSPRGMFTPWSWRHHALVKKPFWYALQKPALGRVDCFHATADSELEDVRRRGFRQPVAVIPNGVEIPDLAGTGKVGQRLVFLSRIHEKKGVHLLIRAWRTLADRYPGWELVIAGSVDSAYGQDMVRLAQEIGAPRLRFAGEVLGREKTELLAGARLFVLPTFSENFGIAIAEALAHGTPAITTVETPWTGLEARGCGWCIQADLPALERTLALAMNRSSEELEAMGISGRRWVAEDYGWQRVAGMMESVYRWLLGQGSRPSCVFD